MKNKNAPNSEQSKGFYVTSKEEQGKDNRTAAGSGPQAKPYSRQGVIKNESSGKQKVSRIARDEEISAKETEDVEQENQDDQS